MLLEESKEIGNDGINSNKCCERKKKITISDSESDSER